MEQPQVTTYYEQDHDRLDDLLKNFQQLKRVDFPKAKPYFREFLTGLQRHIVWEEEILFPIFEEKTGITEGPTKMMRAEHRLIGKHLDAIHDKVRRADPESDDEEQALLNVLSVHNQKEEFILYPAIDRLLTPAERDSIYTAMNELPEERYRCCCDHHQHSN